MADVDVEDVPGALEVPAIEEVSISEIPVIEEVPKEVDVPDNEEVPTEDEVPLIFLGVEDLEEVPMVFREEVPDIVEVPLSDDVPEGLRESIVRGYVRSNKKIPKASNFFFIFKTLTH